MSLKREFRPLPKVKKIFTGTFAKRLYRVVGFSQTDNLAHEVMKHFSDSELATIPDEMEDLLYDTLDWGWISEEEEVFIKDLRKR